MKQAIFKLLRKLFSDDIIYATNLDDIIRAIYSGVLNREPDVKGLKEYREAVKRLSISGVISALIQSDEHWKKLIGIRSSDLVRAVYQGLFGRELEAEKLAIYSTKLAETHDLMTLVAEISQKENSFMLSRPDEIFPLCPPLPLPAGVSEDQLFNWLKHVRVEGATKEIANYCTIDFRRFVYTYGLVREASNGIPVGNGCCLELGSNPYFTTILLKEFTPLKVVQANYFGEQLPKGVLSQNVDYLEFYPQNQDSAKPCQISLDYNHFNIENDPFPYEDASFDIVMLCEIIEHLLMNPAQVLREIRRVLKPGGQMILTTPNVNRLENVARMLSGGNIYDPYSGYGPYGRHNREYNKHELSMLLTYLGFTIQEMFSADVHENNSAHFFDLTTFQTELKFREMDLGQYIFLRATSSGRDRGKKPSWLYRSYPQSELDD